MKLFVYRVLVVVMVSALLPASALAQPGPDDELFDGDPATTERFAEDDPVTLAVGSSQVRFDGLAATHVVLARNDDFADSLAASPLTADGPLLLTPSAELAQLAEVEMQRVLPPGGTVYVLGGTAAIDATVEQQVTAMGYTVVRLQGPDRIATAIEIATETARVYGAGQALTVAVARAFGEGSAAWADSITGGGWAAETKTPILLTPTEALDPRVAQAVQSLGVIDTVVLGGSRAVSDDVADLLPGAFRVSGPNRAATAVQIATDLWDETNRYILFNGYREDGWVFGLTATGLAADADAPLLVADTSSVPPETLARVGAGCETGPPTVDVVLIGTEAALQPVVQQAVDAQDGGECPAEVPPDGIGAPTSLGQIVDIGSGHLSSAGSTRTYWTEFTTATSSCVEGAQEVVTVQDANGRRVTTVPGETIGGLSVDLSPNEQFAIVSGFCDDGWFLKGYADVAADGDLVNFREVGGSYSYDESPLAWRPDNLLYGMVDISPDRDNTDLELRLLDPATGGQAVLLDFPVNSYPRVVVHTPDLIVIEEFSADQTFVTFYDGNGNLLNDAVFTEADVTASPDGQWLVTFPYDDTDLIAYRMSDLMAGDRQPQSTFNPPDGFIADTMWSRSGQLAIVIAAADGSDVHLWEPEGGQAASQSVPLSSEACEYVFFGDFAVDESQLYVGLDSGCSTERAHRTVSMAIQR